MDFYALARRDLQALCKKNQIAANQTNVVMADALASLDHVVGLDEFLNQSKHDAVQSPEKEKPLASVITRSMTRASTRRRTALVPETEQLPSQTTTGRGMRSRNAAAVDKEPKVLDFTETPAASQTKKRAELASVKLKVEKEKAEAEKNEEGDAIDDGTANTVARRSTRQGKTRAPVALSTRMSARRSTRLLEKKMDALKLSDEVTMDLEPIKMGDLIAENELTEESVNAAKDEHPSEIVDTEAKVVACEVETLVEVGTDGKSQSDKACEKNERAVEFEFNTTPAEVESESNNHKNPTKFTEEAEAENKAYNNTGDVAIEVEALVEAVSNAEVLDEAWSEVEEEMQSHSAEIYAKEETAAAESEVDEPAEIETDIKGQNKKLDKVDGSSVGHGASQAGLTSSKEAANGNVHTVSDGKVAPNNGDDISELTAQAASWNLDSPKEDCNKEMDSEVVSIAASNVNTSVVEDGGDVLVGYLADVDGLSELTAKVKSPCDDSDKPEIQGVALSMQPYVAVETQLVEAQMGHPQTQKSVEAVGVEILGQTLEAVKDSNQVCADDIIGKKTPTGISKMNRVPLPPQWVGRMTELLTLPKSSGKKMQPKDGDKENIGYAVEFGKQKNVPELIVTTDEENQKPTSLTKTSLSKLRKMYKEKIQMQNEKRPALQRLPENNIMTVVEEKDD
ncbi:hypothetical protein MLD38_008578 [Melastoma candidum]|uniref:Uncharacterized protein n=1 Tax=Melastoma candidum TaxID=119954 RepID=A0ACB9RVB9_9MYRT|nr:hypothetical protein MLD38_008578 [Melastoma candidum]